MACLGTFVIWVSALRSGSRLLETLHELVGCLVPNAVKSNNVSESILNGQSKSTVVCFRHRWHHLRQMDAKVHVLSTGGTAKKMRELGFAEQIYRSPDVEKGRGAEKLLFRHCFEARAALSKTTNV